MKHRIPRTAAALLLTATLLLAAPATAHAEAGGTVTGSRLTWALNDDGVLTVSGRAEGIPSYALGAAPWYPHRDTIKQVQIQAGVTGIGAYAFADLDAMVSVTLPDTVGTIQEGAFYDADALQSLTIPTYVSALNNDLCSGCDSLSSVTLNSRCTGIGSRAFQNCTALTDIRFPSRLLGIHEHAFANTGLTAVDFPDSLQSIELSAFAGCAGLGSIRFGDRSEPPAISENAFQGVTAAVSYPAGWNASVEQDYGGTLTWQARGSAPATAPAATLNPVPLPTSTSENAPTAAPTATPRVTATPKPTATPKATSAPTPTANPTAAPAAGTAQPSVTAAPTAAPASSGTAAGSTDSSTLPPRGTDAPDTADSALPPATPAPTESNPPSAARPAHPGIDVVLIGVPVLAAIAAVIFLFRQPHGKHSAKHAKPRR